jgi:ankyrin repeat protein
LVRRGVDIDRGHSTDGYTPLYVAAQEGHTSVMEALMDGLPSIDINHLCGAGQWSALHAAASAGHVTACRFLLDAGALRDKHTKAG